MSKSVRAILPFAAAGLLFSAGGAVLAWWVLSHSSWQVRTDLQTVSPLALEITFFLMGAAAIISFKTIRDLFAPVPKKTWILLGLIAAASLCLCIAVVPRQHRIYYDEDIYENIGQNIACLKKAGMCNEGVNDYGEYKCHILEYNKQPNGWPYVLSVVFLITGVHELSAFLTSNALYILSIGLVFLISYLLFESTAAALYGSLVFGLIPEGMMWSNTVAVEPSTVFFSGLTVLSALIFTRVRTAGALFLTGLAAVFASQFRTESIMITVMPALAILLLCPGELKKGRLYVVLAICFILLIPHFAHLYSVRGEGWGASGDKLSMAYAVPNLKVNTWYYFENVRFPGLFGVLFIIGLIWALPSGAGGGEHDGSASLLRKCARRAVHWICGWKKKSIVFIWFLMTWGIFIFFYAGSYNYGADVRYSLVSHIPLALIAGCGAWILTRLLSCLPRCNTIMCFTIIFSFISFLDHMRAEGELTWSPKADHEFAQEIAVLLPKNSVILTHNPNMFLVWGKNAAQASLVTERASYFKNFQARYPGGVYFYYNFWCNVSDPLQVSFCKNILNRYECTLIKEYREKNYRYALYKVENPW